MPQASIDAAWSRGDSVESDTVFSSHARAKAWAGTPTRVVISKQDRFFPVEFQRLVARDRLAIEADDMPGGHLVALSQPVALTTRLLSYVETIRMFG